MTKPLPTDQFLIDQVKAGNQSAFRQIVQRYELPIRTTVVGMLGNAPEADDVAQEVFIRFFRALEQYEGQASLKTYLTRIAINLSLNELKRRQKRQQRWLKIDDEKQTKQIANNHNAQQQFETRELIDQAIQQLEPDFRSVVVLRLVQGYSVKETAELLNIPQGTIASRLARAQVKLQQFLKPVL